MSDQEGRPIDLLNMDIKEILEFFISITSTKAVLYLGARLTEEDEPVKDLGKARTSIDTTQLLVEQLENYSTEEESKQLKEVVRNLQLAYVNET